MSDELAMRDRALVRAVAAWGDMRFAMEQAQPGTSHDCWWMVGASLCAIASSIEKARERAKGNSGNE